MSTIRFRHRHPGWAALFVILFASFPLWSESLWSLFSSDPLVASMAREFGISGLPDFSLGVLLWVTAPIGLLLLVRILYQRVSGRAVSEEGLDITVQVSQPLHIKKVDVLQGEGKSPYWMIVLSDAVIRNRTQSRVSLMFELRCSLNGKPCEIPERSDLDAFIKTPKSPHRFLRGPVALSSGDNAEGDLCFGYAEFPPTREGPELETPHSELVVMDRLSGRKAVLDVHSLVGTGS